MALWWVRRGREDALLETSGGKGVIFFLCWV